MKKGLSKFPPRFARNFVALQTILKKLRGIKQNVNEQNVSVKQA